MHVNKAHEVKFIYYIHYAYAAYELTLIVYVKTPWFLFVLRI